ncbi:MAG TPA: hypothetical protein VI322_04070 [Candidatus Saccharimonadia bacterium]
MGACLGVGLLSDALGGQVTTEFGEPVSPVRITLTPAAAHDPLLTGLPTEFDAFVSHHQGCAVPPQQATVLAGSPLARCRCFGSARMSMPHNSTPSSYRTRTYLAAVC